MTLIDPERTTVICLNVMSHLWKGQKKVAIKRSLRLLRRALRYRTGQGPDASR
jgi:hypothetical protein